MYFKQTIPPPLFYFQFISKVRRGRVFAWPGNFRECGIFFWSVATLELLLTCTSILKWNYNTHLRLCQGPWCSYLIWFKMFLFVCLYRFSSPFLRGFHKSHIRGNDFIFLNLDIKRKKNTFPFRVAPPQKQRNLIIKFI